MKKTAITKNSYMKLTNNFYTVVKFQQRQILNQVAEKIEIFVQS